MNKLDDNDDKIRGFNLLGKKEAVIKSSRWEAGSQKLKHVNYGYAVHIKVLLSTIHVTFHKVPSVKWQGSIRMAHIIIMFKPMIIIDLSACYVRPMLF